MTLSKFEKRSLFISSSFMPKNLFYESSFTIQCILSNIIKVTTLVKTCATRFSFIDEKFMEIVCKILKIQPQCLTKSKLIERFDNRIAKRITHAIYSTLSIENHNKSFILLLIIKLEQYSMILGRLWIKKHVVLLDIINNFITFFLRYCTHLGASLFSISLNPKETKIMFKDKHEDIVLNHILKKRSDKSLDDFLGIIQKLSNKKRQLMNIFKQK